MLEITTEIDGETLASMLSDVDAETIAEFADELAASIVGDDLDAFLRGFLGAVADEELERAAMLLQRERDARVAYAAAGAPDPDATGEAKTLTDEV